ncbi:hypothetical protein CE91St26_19370 [Akkermansia muciniphila]|nr:hypothetical protein CE91St26_19370 [Akkermansia muciniphila]GKI09855.1 hypothetical protein CE91St27_19370 [Akkermansia muciniphila]
MMEATTRSCPSLKLEKPKYSFNASIGDLITLNSLIFSVQCATAHSVTQRLSPLSALRNQRPVFEGLLSREEKK